MWENILNAIEKGNSVLNSYVWGWPTIILILGTGLLLTIRTRCLQVRKFGESLNTTIVTAGDRAFSWGALLLVASMRMNGMGHPVVIGTMDWTDGMKKRLLALGGVTLRELPKSRRCVACQKPMMMGCDDVKTDWVCWADALHRREPRRVETRRGARLRNGGRA